MYLLHLAMLSNFRVTDKEEYSTANTPYDISSIMHYSKKSFIKYGTQGNTIEYKFDTNAELGGSQLSTLDIVELNRLYQCDGN